MAAGPSKDEKGGVDLSVFEAKEELEFAGEEESEAQVSIILLCSRRAVLYRAVFGVLNWFYLVRPWGPL